MFFDLKHSECIEFNVEVRPAKPATKTAAAHTDQKGGQLTLISTCPVATIYI